MKSIVNKALYSLGGTFKTIGRSIGHLYTIISQKIIHVFGTNISVNNTVANAPMRIMLNASELTQAGTPTPSSPQAVHTISGSNKVKVEGKNIINIPDGSYIMTNYWYKDFATNKLITSDMVGKKISFSYDIDIESISTTSTEIIGVIGRGTTPNGMSSQIATATYSPTTGEQHIKIENKTIQEAWVGQYLVVRFAGFNVRSDCTYNYSNVQIEYGETATTYEPYISQETEVDLSSKNLFDKSKVTLNYYYDASLNYTSTSDIELSDYIEVESGKSYTLNYNKTNNIFTNVRINLFNENKTIQQQLVDGQNTVGQKAYNFTIPSGIKYVRFSITTLSDYMDLDTIMFNEGSTALPYEPYYDYGFYGKIGNYEDKFIRNSGKNKLDMSGEIVGGTSYYTYENGIITITSSNTGTSRYWDKKIDVSEGSYTFMVNVITSDARPLIKPLDSSGNTLTNLSISGWTYNSYYGGYYADFTTLGNNISNITLTSAVKQIQIGFVPKTVNSKFDKIYFGEQATDYEPYGSNEWYIKKNIGKVVLDGTNNALTFYNVNEKRSAGYIDITNLLNYTMEQAAFPPKLLSSHLVSVSQNSTWVEGNISMRYQDLNRIYICLTPSFTEASAMNNWLSSNNVSVYYILANPTYTQITGTLANQLENVYQKLLSYTGTTTISQVNNDLPFELEVDITVEE